MGNIKDPQGNFIENLIDAGCDESMVTDCVALYNNDAKNTLLRTLSLHRKNILDAIHANEKQLDCLDFLIFELNKEKSAV